MPTFVGEGGLKASFLGDEGDVVGGVGNLDKEKTEFASDGVRCKPEV